MGQTFLTPKNSSYPGTWDIRIYSNITIIFMGLTFSEIVESIVILGHP
jgi:hypothetical protein